MRWTVLSDTKPKFELLTSDRPILTNGIGKPDGQIIMPISPFHLFVATNNAAIENEIRATWRRGDAVRQINDRVAIQSRTYVWGTDAKQLTFVSKRLGKAYTADPLETLTIAELVASARNEAEAATR